MHQEQWNMDAAEGNVDALDIPLALKPSTETNVYVSMSVPISIHEIMFDQKRGSYAQKLYAEKEQQKIRVSLAQASDVGPENVAFSTVEPLFDTNKPVRVDAEAIAPDPAAAGRPKPLS
jgi:hypothetical protein